MMVDRGLLQPDEAARSKSRHILTNVLGGSTERVEVDVDLLQLENGDRVLLCSDGLTDLVSDDTISRTLGETRTSADACARLVQLALDNGGHDNVTAVVAAYSIPQGRTAA
jgi:serine/threonine protein phosphatase PrpC